MIFLISLIAVLLLGLFLAPVMTAGVVLATVAPVSTAYRVSLGISPETSGSFLTEETGGKEK
jgi:hypothetical protein